MNHIEYNSHFLLHKPNHSLYYNYKDNAYLVESVTDDIIATTKDYEINLKIDGVKKGSDYRLLIKSADILNSLF